MDPTRPAGIGGAQRPTGTGRIDKIGDIAGYNGDGATISDFQNPGVANLVTEYGGVDFSSRPGSYDAGWGSLSTTLTNGFPTEYPWRSGQSRWAMFDHGTLAGTRNEISGMVDYFRLPKRRWYWYRSAYANVPPPTWPVDGTPAALQLTVDKTTLAAVDGTDDAQLIVTAVDSKGTPISNNVPVTLSITSGPGEFPTGTSITFTPPGSSDQSDIAILEGKAAIEFRSYYSGTTVIKATSPGLTAATVTITSQGSPAWVEGSPRLPRRDRTRATAVPDVFPNCSQRISKMSQSQYWVGHFLASESRIREDARIVTMEDAMRIRTRKATKYGSGVRWLCCLRGSFPCFTAAVHPLGGSSYAAGTTSAGGTTGAAGNVNGGSTVATGGISQVGGTTTEVGGTTTAQGGTTTAAGRNDDAQRAGRRPQWAGRRLQWAGRRLHRAERQRRLAESP